jgi:hypothetical protein
MKYFNNSSNYLNKSNLISDDNILGLFISILLILFAVLVAPKLPSTISCFFNNTYFIVIFMIVIILLANKHLAVSLICLIIFFIIINNQNKNLISDSQVPQSTLPQPTIPQPTVPQPIVPQPIISLLQVQQSLVAQPTVPQPTVSQPTVPQPTVSQPIVSQPTVSQPIVSQPIVSQPIVSQPIVSQPIVSQPTVSQPIVPQPTVPQPLTKDSSNILNFANAHSESSLNMINYKNNIDSALEATSYGNHELAKQYEQQANSYLKNNITLNNSLKGIPKVYSELLYAEIPQSTVQPTVPPEISLVCDYDENIFVWDDYEHAYIL